MIHAQLDWRSWQPAPRLQNDLAAALERQVTELIRLKPEGGQAEPTTRGHEPDFADLVKD
jgi:hypothetical protein